MRKKTVVRTAALLCALVTVSAGTAHAQVGGTQVVTSTAGGYAYGSSSSGQLSDGRFVRFYAFFSHPEGTIAGTPAAAGIDLAKPVGALQVEAVTHPPGPNTYGTTTRLCGGAANVISYGLGRAVPTVAIDGSDGVSWTGSWFDIRCESPLGFDFFRVHFDHALREGRPEPAQRFEPDQAGQVRTSKSKGFVGPEMDTPYLYMGGGPIVNELETHWQWGAPGLLGTLVAEPLMRQGGVVTLCGHRAGAEPRCWGGERSLARMYPATTGITHTVAPR